MHFLADMVHVRRERRKHALWKLRLLEVIGQSKHHCMRFIVPFQSGPQSQARINRITEVEMGSIVLVFHEQSGVLVEDDRNPAKALSPGTPLSELVFAPSLSLAKNIPKPSPA